MTGQDMAHLAWELGKGLNNIARMAHGIEPEPILRWVTCEDCGGMGWTLRRMAPDGIKMEETACEACEDGYLPVDEGDSRWAEGTHAHPDDRGR